MAGRRHQFQGQFGLHETPLTLAIEESNFELAEQIIHDTTDPSFLNDGAYENMPLHMVLTNNHHMDKSRNLRLAKLLVQKGANSNLRIPFIELDRASPSPFEELVVYHEVLKSFVDGTSELLCEELDMYFELQEMKLKFITNTVDFDGVKCLPNIESCHMLIKQTSDLIDVFLECGSDPNVITTFAKTLFHWVTEHDIALAIRFLDTCRVDLNLCDVHGNSPLMDAVLRNDPDKTLRLYEAMCDTVNNIDVNISNCSGETALFRAVFVGAVEVAAQLCAKGACMVTNVSLSKVPTSYREECLLGFPPPWVFPTFTTPLLAPLLADAPARLRYSHVPSQDSGTKIVRPHKHLIDKIISSSISPLIDLGSFSNNVIASETASLLGVSTFKKLQNGEVQNTDLLSLMFGQVSAGLRQLCVRSVVDTVFMSAQIPHKIWPHLLPLDFGCDKCGIDCQVSLTESDIEKLVNVLGLPQSFKIFFEIEAAKYQICKVIMVHQSVDCDQACSASDEFLFDEGDDVDEDDDDSFDSSVYSSDYGDSLLFFSSDMLSEESSSEVEDLSDEEQEFSENEDEKSSEGAEGVDRKVPGGQKNKADSESLSSESKAIIGILESLCEDAAEDVAVKHCQKYQRFKDESTTSCESAEDCTASEPPSDSSW